MDMERSEELEFLMNNGALVIQAHPYREAVYIDHIRSFPRHVNGVEVVNALGSESQNNMAKIYAENYGLIKFAGSDNHWGSEAKRLAGMCSDVPILNEQDFINRIKNKEMEIFTLNND